MYQNDSKRQYCSTCEYWTGKRELGRSGQNVFVKHNGQSADCELQKIGKKGGNTNSEGCRKYKKWNHLP